MSAWMKSRYPGYIPDRAPAILMPEANHRATFGVYNKWRAEMAKKMGGKFDWCKVSASQMRQLSKKMFDAAKVPQHIRDQYWKEFARMRDLLER
jgi:HNH/Endo VII superfamily toxin with a SHH signature